MENATQTGAEVQPAEPQDLVGLFAAEIDRKEPQEDAPVDDGAAEETPPSADADAAATPEGEDEPLITVKVNGQELQVKQSELIANYQKDSAAAQKFEEAAQLRKQAESETAQARKERQEYTEKLGQFAQQLEFLQSQPVDWQALLENDPSEYLKQRHIFDQRQIQLNQAKAAEAHLKQQSQVEAEHQYRNYLKTEEEALLSKVPEWKDATKAQAERTAIAHYLTSTGFHEEQINRISDHRVVLMARKAMQFDQLMSKATTATKKVAPLPAKVERPGNGDATKPDGRSEAMKRLQRSGKIEDAARAFSQFL